MGSIDWNDWRIVNAIATTGTTAKAAKLLGMNQSTVFRRITQLEEALGVRLFDRDKHGFRLTLEGESILPEVQEVQRLTTRIERRVTGLDERPEGEVRLSVNSTVVQYLLAETITSFCRLHPEITIRLDLTDRVVDINKREADLVIRGSNDPAPQLFGRKLMRLHYAVYAPANMRGQRRLAAAFKADPRGLDWILWEGDLLKTAPGQWMRANLRGVSPVLTTSDVESTAYLTASGLGCCLLPRFLGERHPDIVSITGNIPGLHTELWVLTHQDLRKTARVSTLLRFIADAVRQTNELP